LRKVSHSAKIALLVKFSLKNQFPFKYYTTPSQASGAILKVLKSLQLKGNYIKSG